MTKVQTNNLELLGRILAALESQDEALAFLGELCTPQEVKTIAQRVGIAELLMLHIPQKEIISMLCQGEPTRKTSSSTVSRVNDVLENRGGYLGRMVARVSGAEGS